MRSMHVREVLGRGIARLRQERGLTQEQLAERIDVSTQFLAAIERAKKTPSFDTLEVVCRVFGVTPSVLFAAGETPAARADAGSADIRRALAAVPKKHEREVLEIVRAVARISTPTAENSSKKVAAARRPKAPRKRTTKTK